MTTTRGTVVLQAHRLYKAVLAPLLRAATFGPGLSAHCRFQPTCSDYAALAVAQHGTLRGIRLVAWRLLRCHPFAPGGWDPVPPVHACAGTIEKTHSTQDLT